MIIYLWPSFIPVSHTPFLITGPISIFCVQLSSHFPGFLFPLLDLFATFLNQV